MQCNQSGAGLECRRMTTKGLGWEVFRIRGVQILQFGNEVKCNRRAALHGSVGKFYSGKEEWDSYIETGILLCGQWHIRFSKETGSVT